MTRHHPFVVDVDVSAESFREALQRVASAEHWRVRAEGADAQRLARARPPLENLDGHATLDVVVVSERREGRIRGTLQLRPSFLHGALVAAYVAVLGAAIFEAEPAMIAVVIASLGVVAVWFRAEARRAIRDVRRLLRAIEQDRRSDGPR